MFPAIVWPLLSQSAKDSTDISKVDRDSLVNKALRGEVNAKRLTFIQKALTECDFIKAKNLIEIKFLKKLDSVNEHDLKTVGLMNTNLNRRLGISKKQTGIETKRAKKNWFKGFKNGFLAALAVYLGVFAFQ